MFTSCYYFSFPFKPVSTVCVCTNEFFWKRKNKDPLKKIMCKMNYLKEMKEKILLRFA